MPPRRGPDFSAERLWWNAGAHYVAGVDEVGRGALAGPLVAAAVILPAKLSPSRLGLTGLTDSKVLSPLQRQRLSQRVSAVAVAAAIGSVSVEEIDTLGLTAANRMAMERAVHALGVVADALLLDAVTIDHDAPQVGVIDGDARCLSIAAASVVAKVHRDGLMADLGGIEDRYGFADHKGYGTEQHLTALAQWGPSAHHRRSFAPVARLTEAGR